jgi:glutamine---fructose-6-phosphate transaminase (isomerizing)
MCGIVGYIGHAPALPLLLSGLRRIEYRGYDSCGIALMRAEALEIVKVEGGPRVLEGEVRRSVGLDEGADLRTTARITQLEEHLRSGPAPSLGIGHTRWATHGPATRANAHPHLDASGTVAVVHNGMVDNYRELRTRLLREGIQFASETDTEVIAQLIGRNLKLCGSLASAVQVSLAEVQGTFGLVVLSTSEPNVMIVARRGSPVLIGVGEGELIVASDPAAVVEHTRHVVYLQDDEMVTLQAGCVGPITTLMGAALAPRDPETLRLQLEEVKKSGFQTFMQKEMHEQPTSLQNTLRGRIDESAWEPILGGLQSQRERLLATREVVFVACGTSYHAGLIAARMVRDFARLPARAEIASEFCYQNPVLDEKTLVVAISQSGETADTLGAMREARRRGALVVGVCNVVGSTIARESDAGVYLHAGPEIAVASTKAFTSQLMVLYLVACHLGRQRHLGGGEAERLLRALQQIPSQVTALLKRHQEIDAMAACFGEGVDSSLFLAMGYSHVVAMEGALKLKEISYVHAEGFPAAELKHGPIALVDKGTPVVAVVPRDSLRRRTLENLEIVRARGGRVLAVATEEDEEVAAIAEHVFWVPACLEPISPILTVVPLQLLACKVALLRGLDPDRPRNLAKSVTVGTIGGEAPP